MPQVNADRKVREHSLDGLRGVAALVVVLGHVLPAAQPFVLTLPLHYHYSGATWWFVNTPLAALWDGPTAVLVFFVLSGFVLVGGRANTQAAWLAYYPSRLLRLYLPVAGAVGMALVLTARVPHLPPVTLHSVLRDVALIRGVDSLDGPLWSLQWEVIFSLLLPLYVVFGQYGRPAPSRAAAKVALALAVMVVGERTGHASLIFLPVFALGAILAVEHDRRAYRTWAERSDARRVRVCTAVVVALAVVTYTGRSLVAAPAEPTRLIVEVCGVVSALGAALMVALALYWAPLRSVLQRPTTQWLGTRSFSLFLIHWPLLQLVKHVVDGAGPGRLVYVALPLSLLAAELFYRAVERPGHLVARRVGRVVAERARQHPAGRPVASGERP